MIELRPQLLHSGARTLVLGLMLCGAVTALFLGSGSSRNLTWMFGLSVGHLAGMMLVGMGLWRLGSDGPLWLRLTGTAAWVVALLMEAGEPLAHQVALTLEWEWLISAPSHVFQGALIVGWGVIVAVGLWVGRLLGVRVKPTAIAPLSMAALYGILWASPEIASPTAVLVVRLGAYFAAAIWLWPLSRAATAVQREASAGQWSLSQGFHLVQGGLVVRIAVSLLVAKVSAAMGGDISVGTRVEALRVGTLANAIGTAVLVATLAEAARRAPRRRQGLVAAALFSGITALALLGARSAFDEVGASQFEAFQVWQAIAGVCSGIGGLLLAVTVMFWGQDLDRADVARWGRWAAGLMAASLAGYLALRLGAGKMSGDAVLAVGGLGLFATIGAQVTLFASVGSLRFALTETEEAGTRS